MEKTVKILVVGEEYERLEKIFNLETTLDDRTLLETFCDEIKIKLISRKINETKIKNIYFKDKKFRYEKEYGESCAP